MLVSPHFLASDFITKCELPPLLDAAAKDGVRVVWIAISACLCNETPIGKYKTAKRSGKASGHVSHVFSKYGAFSDLRRDQKGDDFYEKLS